MLQSGRITWSHKRVFSSNKYNIFEPEISSPIMYFAFCMSKSATCLHFHGNYLSAGYVYGPKQAICLPVIQYYKHITDTPTLGLCKNGSIEPPLPPQSQSPWNHLAPWNFVIIPVSVNINIHMPKKLHSFKMVAPHDKFSFHENGHMIRFEKSPCQMNFSMVDSNYKIMLIF